LEQLAPFSPLGNVGPLASIELAVYDPRWPRLYDAEIVRVTEALTPVVGAEHVGSTSVPGLAAKPTIDIAVGVVSLDLPDGARARMERLDYHYGGDHGQPQHVFRKGTSVPWRFLVHVVQHGGPMWLDFLRFRDYLRANPDEAERYARLKASLLADRGGWYSGRDKERFIRLVLDSCRPSSSEGSTA
jgi:GrpB-like predicted nucleotidyltransferase (UPF0157 family)